MFCRQCGNQLLNNDVFCSKCGSKIIREESIKEPDIQQTLNDNLCNSPAITKKSFVKYKKGIVCFVLYILVVILLYAVTLPKGISTLHFITDPNGLTFVLFEGLGGGIGVFLFFLPLITGMVKLGLVKEAHKVEVFFILTSIHVIGTRFWGYSFWFSHFPWNYAIWGGLAIGIIMHIVAIMRKHGL